MKKTCSLPLCNPVTKNILTPHHLPYMLFSSFNLYTTNGEKALTHKAVEGKGFMNIFSIL